MLVLTNRALRRVSKAMRRVEAARQRSVSRSQTAGRNDDARELAELGRLVQKAGLLDVTTADQTILHGALLDLVARARQSTADGDDIVEVWRSMAEEAILKERPGA